MTVWRGLLEELAPVFARRSTHCLFMLLACGLILAVDGTFFRRWGRHVAEARWAYDGSAQGGKKVAFGTPG